LAPVSIAQVAIKVIAFKLLDPRTQKSRFALKAEIQQASMKPTGKWESRLSVSPAAVIRRQCQKIESRQPNGDVNLHERRVSRSPIVAATASHTPLANLT
jgi:hypothetical protein